MQRGAYCALLCRSFAAHFAPSVRAAPQSEALGFHEKLRLTSLPPPRERAAAAETFGGYSFTEKDPERSTSFCATSHESKGPDFPLAGNLLTDCLHHSLQVLHIGEAYEDATRSFGRQLDTHLRIELLSQLVFHNRSERPNSGVSGT